MKIKRLLTGLAVAGIAVAPAAPAFAESPTEMTPESIAAYAEKAFDDSGLPALSLVVTKDDRVLYAHGYGEGTDGAAVTALTPMRVASLSKSFTAMAVMKLVEAGKIRLDATVASQLPGFTMADPRFAEITVRHLLNQTSGLSDRGLDAEAVTGSPDLAAVASSLADGELMRDPGADYEYCNANYDLAAALVEAASGEPFAEYLDREVFDALGMTGTSLGEAPEGYIEGFGVWATAAEIDDGPLVGGSGNVVSNAEDMGRWLITQNGFGPQLVGPESLSTMHSSSAVDEYAMGWGVEQPGDGGPARLAHAGNLFTYTANQVIIPETGYGFAVMTPSSALYDESYDVLTGLVDMSQGRAAGEVGTLWTVELGIGVAVLAAIGLGVLGVVRARRWAQRRSGHPVWRFALRLSPLALPVLLLAAYPSLVALLYRRDITWEQCWYRAPSVLILLVAGAAAGVAVITARVARVRAARVAR
ncbi:serine hydrolase domain-containing protein [Phytomonospora sp. NPDC050363]|uniref:serine hydrolase domain-containing protein n=1 Tax=Phytomonospora sp. NPDC050363 TaxID=3155642 RepID=UPI0033F07039